jgi:hypothetical protein
MTVDQFEDFQQLCSDFIRNARAFKKLSKDPHVKFAIDDMIGQVDMTPELVEETLIGR